MKKIYMIPMFAILFLGVVFAVGYVVNNVVLQVDVGEPFDVVEYGILGLGSSYDETLHGTCNVPIGTLDWVTYTDGEVVDMGYMDAGESKRVCVRITNNADADITYTITPTVISGGQPCLDAFNGLLPLTGTADKATTTTTGETVTIAQNAVEVEDCQINIDVARG